MHSDLRGRRRSFSGIYEYKGANLSNAEKRIHSFQCLSNDKCNSSEGIVTTTEISGTLTTAEKSKEQICSIDSVGSVWNTEPQNLLNETSVSLKGISSSSSSCDCPIEERGRDIHNAAAVVYCHNHNHHNNHNNNHNNHNNHNNNHNNHNNHHNNHNNHNNHHNQSSINQKTPSSSLGSQDSSSLNRGGFSSRILYAGQNNELVTSPSLPSFINSNADNSTIDLTDQTDVNNNTTTNNNNNNNTTTNNNNSSSSSTLNSHTYTGIIKQELTNNNNNNNSNNNSNTTRSFENVHLIDSTSSDVSKKQKVWKLLIVANRLPVTVDITADTGACAFSLSSGGLVSGLKGINNMNFIWIGWPGNEIPQHHRVAVTRECRKYRCLPVFLDTETAELYYNGFCNNFLWPYLHYIPPPLPIAGSVETVDQQWAAYRRAQAAFVDTILEVYDENCLVWVHDYHLMLVPKLLRERKPEARIGWFLHTPFPSQEIFRMLRFRSELLVGLLSSNLIAFHAYDYLRHFLSSCVQLLGLESTAQGLDACSVGGVFCYCATIPIGIEPQQFLAKLNCPSVLDEVSILRSQFGSKKVILGVDRLDYMKGIPHKLNAFDRFLQLHPSWVDACVMIQLAVPSRSTVPEYQRLKSVVHELVTKINGKRGRLGHVPVHYLDQSLSFEELIALYRVADVALISSLRDGMNLVAYEYVVCQQEKHGVLILSEFAGAAQSLGAGAIKINPWNLDSSAHAIETALTLPSAIKKARHDYAFDYVCSQTSSKWAESFVETLIDASEVAKDVRAAIPPLLEPNDVVEVIKKTQKRLILIDILDSLIPSRGLSGTPVKQFQKLISLPEAVRDALKRLASDSQNIVILSTSHKKDLLLRIAEDLPVCLAAEKGCFYRNREGIWTQLFIENTDTMSWLPGVQKIYDFYYEHTPGSYIERTTASLSFNWDDSFLDFGQQQSRELLVHLTSGPLAHAEAEIVLAQKMIEVRSPLCARDKLLSKILSLEFEGESDPDFILCVGHFPWRDEDVFSFCDQYYASRGGESELPTEPLSEPISMEFLPNEDFLDNRSSGTPTPKEKSKTPRLFRATDDSSRCSHDRSKGLSKACASFPMANPTHVFTVSVGIRVSRARYCLPNAYHVQSLVRQLASGLYEGK